jgi:hypothetical protein
MEMNRQLIQSHEAYEKLLFKEALRTGFFELQAARDKYQLLCGETAMCRQLVLQYIEWQAIVLSPICPHVAEHVWELLGHKVRDSIPAHSHCKRQYFAYTQCGRDSIFSHRQEEIVGTFLLNHKQCCGTGTGTVGTRNFLTSGTGTGTVTC